MPNHDATTLITDVRSLYRQRPAAPALALAVLWSRAEPERVGEIAIPDGTGELGLGRSPPVGVRALELMRQRPGANLPTGPVRSTGISRDQWRVRARPDALVIENVGRRELRHNGAAVGLARARAGDRLEIADELLLLVVERAPELPGARLPPALVPSWGEADAFGIVGESAAAWELRRQLAFAAGREDHVLLSGGSGSGKELAARAIHGLSRRCEGRLIARNAATLPEGLIDAELFGNPRDYPNPGMPERTGLIGAADGSTLMLDEIGELSHALQAHLLRVIDSGEYHRLGEGRARRADVRVVAATNRDPEELKHDLLARLRLRVRLPELAARREDIPLLARHLLRAMAERDPMVAEKVFPGGDLTREPAWTPSFVGPLVGGAYPTNVRELQARLWDAIGRSPIPGLTSVSLPPPARARLPVPADEDTDAIETIDPQTVSAEQIVSALDASGGSRDRAWRALGLRSRHQLVRLMRRFGIGSGRTPALGEQSA